MRGETVQAIRSHRLANKIDRTELPQIEEDLDGYICDQMRGKWAVFDFCETRLNRPPRHAPTTRQPQVFNFQPMTRPRKQSTKVSPEVAAYVAAIQKESKADGKKRTVSCCGQRR